MEEVHKAKPGTVRLYSGRYINVTQLEFDEICIEDIAHALSMKPRFNGNCQEFYSVAAHSINVASLVPLGKKLQALLHDSSEAYLFDIPSPYKTLPEFKEIVKLEQKIQNSVYSKYCLNGYDYKDPVILAHDKNELNREWNLCMINNFLSSNQYTDKIRFISHFCQIINSELPRNEFTDHIFDEAEELRDSYKLSVSIKEYGTL